MDKIEGSKKHVLHKDKWSQRTCWESGRTRLINPPAWSRMTSARPLLVDGCQGHGRSVAMATACPDWAPVCVWLPSHTCTKPETKPSAITFPLISFLHLSRCVGFWGFFFDSFERWVSHDIFEISLLLDNMSIFTAFSLPGEEGSLATGQRLGWELPQHVGRCQDLPLAAEWGPCAPCVSLSPPSAVKITEELNLCMVALTERKPSLTAEHPPVTRVCTWQRGRMYFHLTASLCWWCSWYIIVSRLLAHLMCSTASSSSPAQARVTQLNPLSYFFPLTFTAFDKAFLAAMGRS